MNSVLAWPLWWIVLLIAGVLPRAAVAQDQDVPPPKPPFVATLPDSISWTMAFSKPKRAQDIKPQTDLTKQAAGDVYVRTVEVTKSGELRREVTSFSNGAVTEAWVVGDMNVSENQSKLMVVRPVSSFGKAPKNALKHFPLLEWISLQNYKDVEVIGGKKCYVFKQVSPLTEVAAGYFAMLPGMTSQTSAFIEVESGLPVSTQVNEVAITYTFGPGSNTSLTLPEKFQQEITRYQNAMRRLTQLPSAP